jgi:cytochrome c oxidase assembly factor CtaG
VPTLTGVLADAGSGPWGSPFTVALMAFMLLLYEYGNRRLAEGSSGPISARERLAGRVAIAVLWASVASPLDVAAASALWVHMVQHLLIGLVAPLLWIHARPVQVFGACIEPRTRTQLTRTVAGWRGPRRLRRTNPVVGVAVTLFHVAVWWAWHLPVAFDAALRNPALHALEHLCLFVAGVALWWVCSNVRWGNRGGLAIVYLFVAAVGTGIVGAFLTIDPTPLYATTSSGVARWGLTRLTDQQLAGAIMWVVGGAIYLGVASVLAIRWLSLGPSRDRNVTRTHRPTLDDLLR